MSTRAREAVWEARSRRWLAEPPLQLATAASFFTLVAVVSASQLYVNWAAAGLDTPYWALLGIRLVDWWLWALAVPLVVHVDRLLRRGARSWLVVAGTHVCAATGWFAVQNVVPVLLAPQVDPAARGQAFVDAYLARGTVRLSTAWVVYAAILAVVALLRDFVRRQSLTRDLYDAQLRALRAQMQPHFLFNTLHTVGGLVRTGDRERAIGTLVALSELLRRSLTHTGEDEVPLAEEMEFLDRYLAIQRARFGDRLVVTTSVDPAARDTRVPPLVLQPLVENAIRHGLDLDNGPGSVAVEIRREDDRLLLRVVDDGGTWDRDAAAASPADEEGGIGLSNLRDRLERLYGREQALDLRLTDGGATAVTIAIPVRRG